MDSASTTILLVSPLVVAALFMMFSSSSRWDPKGKHCFVTGGSQGMGLSLAILLVKQGAHVSIVARNTEKLQDALKELEKVRQSPEQILRWYSFSLNEPAASKAAIEASCEPHGGKSPDVLFLCAGVSRPRFFVEETEATFKEGMDATYWLQAWPALAGVKRMVRDKVRGKIVFVSSYLGYMSMVGYSSYAPGKHALRGLAETLRSELLLYSISVHIYFPGTIYSQGLVEENKTKPQITQKLEETDSGNTPDEVAVHLLEGIEKGHFHITGDLLGNIFRSSTRGATPHNNVFMDALYSFVGWVGLPIWRRSVDSTVIKHQQEHNKYLADIGFFGSSS